MKLSILMLTIDRYEVTKKALEHNLRHMGVSDYELLVADNGSTDKRIIDHIAAHPSLSYHRVNSRNEGVGKAFNQLFLRAKGDLIAFLGNDITMPDDWAIEAWKYIEAVPNAGIIGIDWGHSGLPPIGKKFGYIAHWLTPQLNRVFGSWVVHRRVIDCLGLFYEGFHEYGIEDSDFNERVNRAGFNSLYLPNARSQHLCHDVGEKSHYRAMKDSSLSRNLTIFAERVKGFDAGETLIAPLPEMRPPL